MIMIAIVHYHEDTRYWYDTRFTITPVHPTSNQYLGWSYHIIRQSIYHRCLLILAR